MGFSCVKNKGECTGCMACQEPQGRYVECDICGERIYVGETYYELYSDIYCESCLKTDFGHEVEEEVDYE